jgi:hypothetical protein
MAFSSIGKSIYLEVNFRPLCKVLCAIKHFTSAHSRVLINVQYVILSAMRWTLWNYVNNNGWITLQLLQCQHEKLSWSSTSYFSFNIDVGLWAVKLPPTAIFYFPILCKCKFWGPMFSRMWRYIYDFISAPNLIRLIPLID